MPTNQQITNIPQRGWRCTSDGKPSFGKRQQGQKGTSTGARDADASRALVCFLKPFFLLYQLITLHVGTRNKHDVDWPHTITTIINTNTRTRDALHLETSSKSFWSFFYWFHRLLLFTGTARLHYHKSSCNVSFFFFYINVLTIFYRF